MKEKPNIIHIEGLRCREKESLRDGWLRWMNPFGMDECLRNWMIGKANLPKKVIGLTMRDFIW